MRDTRINALQSLFVLTLTLGLIGWLSAPAHAIFVSDNLGSASAVDVWEVKCSQPSNRVCADVADEGTLGDVVMVTVVGQAPTQIANKASTIYTIATVSPQICVFRPTLTNSTLRATVLISSLDRATPYSSIMQCYNATGVATTTVATRKQNQ